MEKRPRETCNKERCLSFISKLWEADHLAMFHHPVSATEVPGYYDVITSPMDLSTIKANIEKGKYESDTDVQDDVALMISNALEFNDKGTAWYNLAKWMRTEYLTLARQSGLDVDADAAFIPAKKARDDESTIRKAEAKYGEELDCVLSDLEKEKEIPLEELRKRYSRTAANDKSADESGSEGGSSADSDLDSDEELESDSYDSSSSSSSGTGSSDEAGSSS